jgi:hypothetical protein
MVVSPKPHFARADLFVSSAWKIQRRDENSRRFADFMYMYVISRIKAKGGQAVHALPVDFVRIQSCTLDSGHLGG